MTAVVDASVLVAALTDAGIEGQWAASVLTDTSLNGPAIVLAEAANTLRGMELTRRLSQHGANAAYEHLSTYTRRYNMRLFPFTRFAERVWELRYNLTIYDAWYVAIAEFLHCPLATLDRRLSGAAGPTCEIVTPPAQ